MDTFYWKLVSSNQDVKKNIQPPTLPIILPLLLAHSTAVRTEATVS